MAWRHTQQSSGAGSTGACGRWAHAGGTAPSRYPSGLALPGRQWAAIAAALSAHGKTLFVSHAASQSGAVRCWTAAAHSFRGCADLVPRRPASRAMSDVGARKTAGTADQGPCCRMLSAALTAASTAASPAEPKREAPPASNSSVAKRSPRTFMSSPRTITHPQDARAPRET